MGVYITNTKTHENLAKYTQNQNVFWWKGFLHKILKNFKHKHANTNRKVLSKIRKFKKLIPFQVSFSILGANNYYRELNEQDYDTMLDDGPRGERKKKVEKQTLIDFLCRRSGKAPKGLQTESGLHSEPRQSILPNHLSNSSSPKGEIWSVHARNWGVIWQGKKNQMTTFFKSNLKGEVNLV